MPVRLRAPGRSSTAVAAFYRAPGTPAPTMDGAWETTAAALAERRVWIELGVRRVTRTVE